MGKNTKGVKDKLKLCSYELGLDNLGSNSVDLIYTDPPFGIGKTFKTKDKQVAFADRYSQEDLYKLYLDICKRSRRVLKPTGLLYFHCSFTNLYIARKALDKVFGIDNLRNQIIWYFNSGARKDLDLGKRHEIILRYSKTGDYKFRPVRVPYSPSAPRGYGKEKYYHPDGKVMDDVWAINNLGQNDKRERVGFPTQKPLELLTRIIKLSTDPGDVVLDPMMGSGTTLVAARLLGRRFIGFDNSEVAYEIAKRRLYPERYA